MKEIYLSKVICRRCGFEAVGFRKDTNIDVCMRCGSTDIKFVKDNQAVLYDDDVEPIKNALPYNVSKDEVKNSIILFLAKGRYAPDDIVDETKIYIFGIYVPVNIYKIYYRGLWSAVPGRYEERTYYRREGGRLVEKKELVLKWFPRQNGIIEKETAIFCSDSYLVEGSEELVKFVEGMMYSIDYNSIVSIVDSQADFAENKRTANVQWTQYAQMKLSDEITSSIKNQFGYQFDVVDRIEFNPVKIDILSSSRVFVPLYIAYSYYKNTAMKFLIRGNDGKFYYWGKKPKDKSREKRVNGIWNWFLAMYWTIWASAIFALMGRIKWDESVTSKGWLVALLSFVIMTFLGIAGSKTKNEIVVQSIEKRKEALRKKGIDVSGFKEEDMHDTREGSPKSRAIALLLNMWGGFFGIHNFYVNKVGLGVYELIMAFVIIFLMEKLPVLGWLFLIIHIFTVFVEHVLIVTGNFSDNKNRNLKEW